MGSGRTTWNGAGSPLATTGPSRLIFLRLLWGPCRSRIRSTITFFIILISMSALVFFISLNAVHQDNVVGRIRMTYQHSWKRKKDVGHAFRFPSTQAPHYLNDSQPVATFNLTKDLELKKLHLNLSQTAGRKYITDHGLTDQKTCEEHNITGLVGRQRLDLRDISMTESADIILGHAIYELEKVVKLANDDLREKLMKQGQAAKESDNRFRSVLKSRSVQLGSYIYMPGGHWKPINCRPRWKVAIIIPFRNRYHHLPIILRYLTPMLKRQLLEFTFFVVEQANRELFNRAMLMNVGFLEALNFTDYDCFIFHDVDHVPHDDRNYYGCSGMPRHFLSGVDRWNYKLMYEDFFGAVTGLTRAQILQINGFPNVYWGWGGEDDEIRMRVWDAHLNITRPKGPIGYYDVIYHHHNRAPPSLDRFTLLDTFRDRHRKDGLSNIVYPNPTYTFNLLYTNVSVDIKQIHPREGEMKTNLSH